MTTLMTETATLIPANSAHDKKFLWVRWNNHQVEPFTPTQARILRCLWKAMAKGIPEVHGRDLLKFAKSVSDHLAPLFFRHESWGTLVIPGERKGTVRLNPKAFL